MATEIVGSLFGVTPEMFQQRQAEMADRQALEYAQLSPLQRASFNIARGGYQLAGALGGQDPQLQMISRRQAIARQIDPTNLNSMQMGIQALAQAGDQVGAMQLSQVLRQAENDIALRSQREASATASLAAATRERSQAVPASIQEANRISQITQTLQNPELSPYERMGLEAEMQQLRKTSTTETQTPEIRNAAALASLKGVPGSPEYAQEFQSQLSRLTAKTEVREPTTNEITNARAVALQAGPVGSPEYNAAFNAEYNRLTAPKEAREPTTNEITNARAVAAQAGPVGSPEYIAAFREEYNRLTAPKESREPTTSELTNARAIALRAGPEGSPEYNAAFNAEYSRLTTRAEGREPTTSELTNARAIALRAGPVGSDAYNAAFEAEYRRLTAPREQQAPDAVRQYEFAKTPAGGNFKGTFEQWKVTQGPRVEVKNVIGPQDKGINANKVKLAGEVESGALSAPDRVTLARNMRNLLPTAFTGFGSDVKLEASRVAQAFGIPVTGTTESQIIDQILGQMTIGAAGQLKGALSDKDREFLKQTIGTRGLTRATLEFVATRIERDARVDEELNDMVNKWQAGGKSLNDFNFVKAKSEAASKIDKDISRLEELRRKEGRR